MTAEDDHAIHGGKRYLVLGANGRTGRAFLAQALAAGDTVTALVRSEDRLADLHHPRLTIEQARRLSPDALAMLDATGALQPPQTPNPRTSRRRPLPCERTTSERMPRSYPCSNGRWTPPGFSWALADRLQPGPRGAEEE